MKRFVLVSLLCALSANAEIVRPPANAVRNTEGKSVTFDFPGWSPTGYIPAACYSSDCVIVQRFEAPFGRSVKIKSISAFVGFDQNNSFEAAIDVVSDDGTRLFQRSVHKEGTGDYYDAWTSRDYDNFKARSLTVFLRAQNSSPTAAGRVHFSLVVLVD